MTRRERAVVAEVMRDQGAKGGRKGGVSRWKDVTPEERSKLMRAAAKKRWAKKGAKR